MSLGSDEEGEDGIGVRRVDMTEGGILEVSGCSLEEGFSELGVADGEEDGEMRLDMVEGGGLKVSVGLLEAGGGGCE